MGRHQTRDHDCLRLALDDGSGQLKIAGQHVLKGEDAQTVGIDIVYLQQGFSELEQKFVIDDSDNKFDHLLQGDHQVTQWTNNNPGRDHKVIANQKFAFFKKYQTHPLTKCFWKALEGFAGKPGDRGNLHEFTQWRYEEIRKASIDFYKRHKVEGLRWPSQYWDDIAIELIITVPAVWDNHTCSILRNAAADAGFKNVNLRLEPICAAALHMRTLKEKGTIQDGEVLAFIDTGHLTNDRAAVKYETGPDGEPELEIVGTPHGDAYGAHYITTLAIEYARSCPEVVALGGFEEALRRLGDLPEETFYSQVSQVINRMKEVCPRSFPISISAMDAHRETEGGLSSIIVGIGHRQMQQFLTEWAKKVVISDKEWLRTLNSQNDHGLRIRGLLVTGGGGRNQTLLSLRHDELTPIVEHVYESHTVRNHDVAKGCLGQYIANKVDELDYGYFYISRNDPATSTPHKASQSSRRKRKPNNSDGASQMGTANRPEESIFQSRGYLIMQRLHNEPLRTPRVPMRFEIDSEKRIGLESTLYFSKTRFDNGVLLHSRNGSLKDSFEPFSIADLSVEIDVKKYENELQLYDQCGTKCFEIEGFVELELIGAHLDIVITLLKPGENFRCDDRGNVLTHVNYRVLLQKKGEVWDKFRSVRIPNKKSKSLEPSQGSSSRSNTPATRVSSRLRDRSATKPKYTFADMYNCDEDDEEPLPPPPDPKDDLEDYEDTGSEIEVVRPTPKRARLAARDADAEMRDAEQVLREIARDCMASV